MASAAFSPLGCPGHVPITSDHTKITEAIGTCGYDLSLLAGIDEFWDALDLDCGNLRASNEAATAAYSFEPVAFNHASRSGWLLFDSSPVISTSVAKTWKLWPVPSATLPAATDTLGRNNVWTGDELVLHLEEDPAGSAPQFVDSTGNGHDGTNAAGTLAQATGQIGGGIDFTSAAIECGTGVDDNLGAGFTWECWFNSDSVPHAGGILTTYDGQNANGTLRQGVTLQTIGSNNRQLRILYQETPNIFIGRLTDNNAWSTGSLHRITATWDGSFSPSGFRLRVNGVRVDTTDVSQGTVTQWKPSNLPFTLGRSYFSSGNTPMDGKLDFVRVSAGARSADYDSTNYNWQSSPGTFWSTGAWVENTPAFRAAWHVQQRRLRRMVA